MNTSAPDVLRTVRVLRVTSALLEALVILAVAGSALAAGSVHPWAYVPLWMAAGVAVLLTAARAALVRSLRAKLGRSVITLHPAGQWVTLETPGTQHEGWRFDLARPVLGNTPLLWPGIAFVALIGLQLVAGLTVSRIDTVRGLAFVATALGLHLAAGSVLSRHEARGRFLSVLGALALFVGFIALFQVAAEAHSIYGIIKPVEGEGVVYGPFVNRNNFATWMAMMTATCLALGQSRWRRYTHRVGDRPNLRRRLVALQSREGTLVLYAAMAAFVGTAALLASTSRAGILAFLASLVLVLVSRRRGGGVSVWAMGVAFVAVGLLWFGLARLEARFERVGDDAPGRLVVWKDALARMPGLWLTGSGFNTFGMEMSRVAAWGLPQSATPWVDDLQVFVEKGTRLGYRSPEKLPGVVWYREAHSDYLQVLVETGVPGLLVALWAGGVALYRARGEPWRFAALAIALFHALVDFPLQIPAVAVLFVVLAANSTASRSTSDASAGVR
jgi:O-antigen ligase